MTRLATFLVTTLLLLSIAAPHSTFAQEPAPDLPLIGGRFYTQASGQEGSRLGYAVVDDAQAPFWREYQRLGGPSIVGYPITRRFVYGGFVTQAFQKLVFQWKPGENRLDFVNVFDVLGDNGRDEWLLANKQVPKRGSFNEEGKGFDEIQKSRLALLESNPAIRTAYFGVQGDPVAMNGLPTAEIADFSNVQVLRAQRVVYQYWKEAVPWAAARTVTVANGGDVAKEAGLFPDEAVRPMTLVEATAPAGSAPSAGSPSAPPAPGGSAAAPAPTTAPSAAPSGQLQEVDQIRVQATASTTTPKAGVPFKVTVRATDGSGRPIVGAVALILVHYPLKSDDTIYAVDGVFFSRIQTDNTGTVVLDIQIDPAVPPGVGATAEVSVIYPPTAGRTEISFVVS